MLHMEQKSYKLEIVGKLLNSGMHTREIARKLNINPMTISRKIEELVQENIVDFDCQGKNKVYFLKNNPESRAYVFIYENYFFLKTLKKYPNLRRIFEKIQKNKRVKLAILFGSYAKGIVKKGSDIDIFMETNDHKIKKDLEKINSEISVKIGKYNKEDYLIREITKNHVIIKGVENYYEYQKFFD